MQKSHNMEDLEQKFDVLKEAIQSKLAEIVHSKEQLEQQSEETLTRIREERRLLEEDKSRMTEVMKFRKSKVKLDVGGCKYTTSLATLTSVPDSMLGAWASRVNFTICMISIPMISARYPAVLFVCRRFHQPRAKLK